MNKNCLGNENQMEKKYKGGEKWVNDGLLNV